VRTLIGVALGTLLSLGAVTSASAAGAHVAAPAQVPAAGIEVIVVTAKRLPTAPVAAAQPIDEFVVIAKRVATPGDHTPPAMAIETPKLELAIGGPPVVRL
jgi:hypothetical protein